MEQVNNKYILFTESDSINLKEQCDKLSTENTTLQNKIFQLESKIKNFNDKCNKNDSNYYLNTEERLMAFSNTSRNFMIKSEFICAWEKFGKVDIINNFVDFEGKPKILFQLIQEMFYIMNNLINEYIDKLYEHISDIMRLPNNFETKKFLKISMKPIVKEYFSNIFQNDLTNNDNFFNYSTFFIKYKKFFIEKIDNSNDGISIFDDIINNKIFYNMLENVKNILIFINFNEVKITLNIEEYEKRKYIVKNFNSKNEFLAPFSYKDKKNNYIILLNPPYIRGIYNYDKGILPIVMPIDEEVTEQFIGVGSNNLININNSNILNNTSNNNTNNNKNIITNNGLINIKCRKFIFESNNNSVLNSNSVKSISSSMEDVPKNYYCNNSGGGGKKNNNNNLFNIYDEFDINNSLKKCNKLRKINISMLYNDKSEKLGNAKKYKSQIKNKNIFINQKGGVVKNKNSENFIKNLNMKNANSINSIFSKKIQGKLQNLKKTKSLNKLGKFTPKNEMLSIRKDNLKNSNKIIKRYDSNCSSKNNETSNSLKKLISRTKTNSYSKDKKKNNNNNNIKKNTKIKINKNEDVQKIDCNKYNSNKNLELSNITKMFFDSFQKNKKKLLINKKQKDSILTKYNNINHNKTFQKYYNCSNDIERNINLNKNDIKIDSNNSINKNKITSEYLSKILSNNKIIKNTKINTVNYKLLNKNDIVKFHKKNLNNNSIIMKNNINNYTTCAKDFSKEKQMLKKLSDNYDTCNTATNKSSYEVLKNINNQDSKHKIIFHKSNNIVDSNCESKVRFKGDGYICEKKNNNNNNNNNCNKCLSSHKFGIIPKEILEKKILKKNNGPILLNKKNVANIQNLVSKNSK